MTSRRRARSPWADRTAPYLFLLPALAVFAVFYLWPAANTLVSSLFRWSVLSPWNPVDPASWDFVGLNNYARVLESGRFWNDVLNTAIWFVVFPLATTVCSLAIAIMIWTARRGGLLFRTIFLLPMTISLTAAGVLWALVYNPDYGSLSAIVGALGLDRLHVDLGMLQLHLGNWLSDPGRLDLGPLSIRFVNLAVILPAVWALSGFGVVSFTAGLSAIPEEHIEAAEVEGATRLQIVRYVVVPQLRNVLIIVGVVFVIYALRTFDIVWVMTRGGPGTDTETLGVLLWNQALTFLETPQAGEATAVAVLLSAVMVVGAAPYLRQLLEERR